MQHPQESLWTIHVLRKHIYSAESKQKKYSVFLTDCFSFGRTVRVQPNQTFGWSLVPTSKCLCNIWMVPCLCYAHEFTKIHQIIRGKTWQAWKPSVLYRLETCLFLTYWRTCFCMKELKYSKLHQLYWYILISSLFVLLIFKMSFYSKIGWQFFWKCFMYHICHLFLNIWMYIYIYIIIYLTIYRLLGELIELYFWNFQTANSPPQKLQGFPVSRFGHCKISPV